MKRLHAETLIKLGGMEKAVIKEVGCSRSTYYNYKQNIRFFDQSWAPSISRIGRPSLFTQEMRDVALHDLLYVNIHANIFV